MRQAKTLLFPFTVLLVLLSLGLFGYGVFLHAAPPQISPGKAVSSSKAGPAKASHTKPVKAAARPAKPVNTQATGDAGYLFLLAGGAGLLVSAFCGLMLGRPQTVPQSAHSSQTDALHKGQLTAWEKQRRALDSQREQLQTQLQEAQSSKAEMDRQRQYASRQFQEFFRTLPIACFCFAADGKIVRWNAACETLYGISAAAAFETTLWETLVPPEGREVMEAWMSRVLAGESLLDVSRQDRTAGGELLMVRSSMVPLLDAAGGIIGGLSASMHIVPGLTQEGQASDLHSALQKTLFALETQQAEVARLTAALAAAQSAAVTAEQAQAEEAERDVVTGLCGLEAFENKLRIETERAARYHTPLSVVMLDLDAFTHYNHTLDAKAGDAALKAVAALIENKLRTMDVVARCGADEYGLILPETGQAGASVAAERLRNGLAGIAWPKQALTACFGIAVLTPDVSSPEELAARAADALRCAKSLGANSIVNHGDALPPAAKKVRAPRMKKSEAGIS